MWSLLNLTLFLGVFAIAAILVIWMSAKVRRLGRRLTELQTEQSRVFEFLHGIGEAFSDGVRSQELHRRIVDGAVRILDARAGALYLSDKNGRDLTPSHLSAECPAFFDVPEDILERARKTPDVLQGFLALHPVSIDDSGPLSECWRSVDFRIATIAASDRKQRFQALLGPLVYRNRVLGVLALSGPPGGTHFSDNDLHVLRAIAGQSAFALHNEVVYLEAGQKKLIDRDLEIARDIQRILLPESAPDFSGYEISGVSHAAGHLSGDYFDYVPLEGGRLAVVIADVSGKGVPASLIMAMCRGVLRSEARLGETPGDVLRAVNHLLYPDIKEDMFVSMAYVILHGPDGHVSLARAGHDAPLLYRAATGEVEKLTPKGMALGIDSGEVFNRVCNDLGLLMEPGDCMALYTDGATEAMNADGLEYGIDRLAEALKASASRGAAEVLRHVAADVRAFTGHDLNKDDFTLIAISKK
ncbi:MAG: PP2C family protein-serine/threonine phosphatase [Verrucomicrobiota bacterium]